jgi:hypothetical protein
MTEDHKDFKDQDSKDEDEDKDTYYLELADALEIIPA